MGKNLLSSLGATLSQLKVMCGLSVDSSAKEEKAVAAVRRDPIPSARFLHVYKQRKHEQRVSIEFKVSVVESVVCVWVCMWGRGVGRGVKDVYKHEQRVSIEFKVSVVESGVVCVCTSTS